jgi:hypothetical protein
MSEEMLKMLEVLGDDAKSAFIIYLVFDYGSLWLLIGLVTWGVRTVWKRETQKKSA